MSATAVKGYRAHRQADDFSRGDKSENLDELNRSRPGLPIIQEATDSLLQAKLPSNQQPILGDNADPTEDISLTEDISHTSHTEDMPQSFRKAASEAARALVSNRMDNSKVANNLSIMEIPELDINELKLGRRLGKGSFSDVDEIQAILLQMNTAISLPKLSRNDSVALDDRECRQFIAAHCIRASGDSRYAMKTLRRDVVDDKERLVFGMCGLATEVQFLSGLTHPHIIKLRAKSSASVFSPDCFLVLDRLYDTLTTRLLEWQSRKKSLTRFLGRLMDPKGLKLLDFYEDRILRAYDLSAALEYCHTKNIIHRDVKPDNIAFDCRGDIKLFDFGLASELRVEKKIEDGTYKLSMMTGSLRYMAPEVWLGKPYNAACDVYSFTLLLWQMLALRQPFSKIVGEEAFVEKVVKNNARPPLKKTWRAALKTVISDCWSQDMKDRMTMAQVRQQLQDELLRLRQGDDSGLDHQLRRSTHIFDSPAAHQKSMREMGIMDLSFHSDIDSSPS